MAEGHLRKTEARSAERARLRLERERNETIKRLIPFGILGVAALFLIGLALYGTLRSSGLLDDPNAKPTFTVDRERLELGDQKLGSTVRAQFNIKNTGPGRLRLTVPPMPTALEGC